MKEVIISPKSEKNFRSGVWCIYKRRTALVSSAIQGPERPFGDVKSAEIDDHNYFPWLRKKKKPSQHLIMSQTPLRSKGSIIKVYNQETPL